MLYDLTTVVTPGPGQIELLGKRVAMTFTVPLDYHREKWEEGRKA